DPVVLGPLAVQAVVGMGDRGHELGLAVDRRCHAVEAVIGERGVSRVRLSWTPISGIGPGGTGVGRKPMYSADEKLKAVLTIVRGEMSQVELGRRMELAEIAV